GIPAKLSLESLEEGQEGALQIAEQAETLAAAVDQTVEEELEPALENAITYMFKGRAGQLKEHREMLDDASVKLRRLGSKVDENPMVFRQKGLFHMLTVDDKALKDIKGHFKEEFGYLVGLIDFITDDVMPTVEKISQLARRAKTPEDTVEVWEQVKKMSNPGLKLSKLSNGSKGVYIMFNRRFFVSDDSRGAGRDSGEWETEHYLNFDGGGAGDHINEKVSKIWGLGGLAAGAVLAAKAGATLVPGIWIAVGAGIMANGVATRIEGGKIAGVITSKDLMECLEMASDANEKLLKEVAAEKGRDGEVSMLLAHIDDLPRGTPEAKAARKALLAVGRMLSGMQWNTFEGVFTQLHAVTYQTSKLAQSVIKQNS